MKRLHSAVIGAAAIAALIVVEVELRVGGLIQLETLGGVIVVKADAKE